MRGIVTKIVQHGPRGRYWKVRKMVKEVGIVVGLSVAADIITKSSHGHTHGELAWAAPRGLGVGIVTLLIQYGGPRNPAPDAIDNAARQ